ncbi:MAG: hypothetical protein PHG14_00360 [Desulfobacter postgatei]|uniref:hypothetical protein n=1 Tax=Desulfobacter postgatei TaxID=2293 RepID=UPI0023F00182|nr:hypothetical protein [Desulfobacter postgatei]MDD4272160.1 hypothetical protein [Desulfobacter postgatei]
MQRQGGLYGYLSEKESVDHLQKRTVLRDVISDQRFHPPLLSQSSSKHAVHVA